jgi:hypothetical protein
VASFITCYNQGAFGRLIKALGLPGRTSSATLSLNAGELARLDYTVLVTDDNITELAALFEDGQLAVGDQVGITRYLQEPEGDG